MSMSSPSVSPAAGRDVPLFQRGVLLASILGGFAYLLFIPASHIPAQAWIKGSGVGLLTLFALLGLVSSARARLDRLLLVLGLAFCTGGDVLLVVVEGLAAGLGSFLIGHLFLIALFWRHRGQPLAGPRLGLLALVMALAVIGLALVAPRAGDLMMPVIVYTLVLTTMAVMALRTRLHPWAPAIGGVLFVISDSILSLRVFGLLPSDLGVLPGLAVWATYYLAMLAIALGATRGLDRAS